MQTMGEVMQPEVFEDFRRSFSINNIRSLVKTRTRDYGGDFQRLFGTEYRWVNVRLLFDESLNPDEAVLCFREVDEEKREQLQHMELLTKRLQKKGYDCSFSMQVREEKEKKTGGMEPFLGQESHVPMAHYAFDMRA